MLNSSTALCTISMCSSPCATRSVAVGRLRDVEREILSLSGRANLAHAAPEDRKHGNAPKQKGNPTVPNSRQATGTADAAPRALAVAPGQRWTCIRVVGCDGFSGYWLWATAVPAFRQKPPQPRESSRLSTPEIPEAFCLRLVL